MSIYPVRLAEWFPAKPKKSDKKWLSTKEQKNQHESMKLMIKYAECHKCGRKKIDWRYAYGHHSLPWGNGDVWCTKRCFNAR